MTGREITIRRPKDAVEQGICLLTEDRKREGLILDMPIYVNITLTDLAAVSRAGLLQGEAERTNASRLVQELAIKTPSLAKWARYLSGGNQQKLVLAKWLFRQPQVFIFDEPTRGIDVGARREIYELLWRLAADGKAIIIVSSDLPELLGICHRILVFSNHRIAGEVARPDFSQERILELAYQNYLNGAPQPGSAAA